MSAVTILDLNGELRLQGTMTGGGSQPSDAPKWYSATLSSAEILALPSPKVIAPAPGGRNYYVPLAVVLHFRHGATPYTGPFTPWLGFGSTIAEAGPKAPGSFVANSNSYSASSPLLLFTGLLASTTDAYQFIMPPGTSLTNGGTWNAWPANLIENKAIAFGIDGDGPILASSVGSGGTGYAANDTGTISSGNGDAAYTVTTVAAGVVTAFTLSNPGTDYNVGALQPTAVSTGGGDGAFTVNINSVAGVAGGDGTLTVRVLASVIDGA